VEGHRLLWGKEQSTSKKEVNSLLALW